jgi:hypothetical protein
MARGALRTRCPPARATLSDALFDADYYPRQEHIDYLSIQALLFQHKKLSLFRQTKLFFSFRKRLSD